MLLKKFEKNYNIKNKLSELILNFSQNIIETPTKDSKVFL